jgi:hypothetical protein
MASLLNLQQRQQNSHFVQTEVQVITAEQMKSDPSIMGGLIDTCVRSVWRWDTRHWMPHKFNHFVSSRVFCKNPTVLPATLRGDIAQEYHKPIKQESSVLSDTNFTDISEESTASVFSGKKWEEQALWAAQHYIPVHPSHYCHFYSCLLVYIYSLSLCRSVVHNENMLQNK